MRFGSVDTEKDIKLVITGTEPYVVSHTALQAAAASGNTTIVTIAAGEKVDHVIVEPTVAFSGPGITGYTVEVGVSGDEDKYKSAFDVTQIANQERKVMLPADLPSWSSTTDILVTGRATGANTDQSTQGSVTIHLGTSKDK